MALIEQDFQDEPDIVDIVEFEEALKEYEESGRKSRPIEELWKELEI